MSESEDADTTADEADLLGLIAGLCLDQPRDELALAALLAALWRADETPVEAHDADREA